MNARFRPVRAGIVGIWDYAEQVFAFADGRLVLRGANGSGKTKALEVLVPFVLDGSIDARRLDPFSGQERTMRSNLLFGGETQRHGYCWIEFANGAECVAIGVGLRARETSTDVESWFFVVDGRMGEAVEIVDAERKPLTRAELERRLGPGRFFRNRKDYRDAIDRRLFGLGSERYDAMIELVLTLRRPQLAKGLDPEALSDILSQGLRTVDDDLLRTSATAFDELEQVQRELTSLERANRAVDELVRHWRDYLRTRAARRGAHRAGRRDHVDAEERALAEKEAHIGRKAREAAAKREQIGELDQRDAGLAGDERALRESEAYRAVGRIDDLKREAQTASQARERANAALARAVTSAKGARGRRDQALDAHRQATDDEASLRRGLVDGLRRLGIEAADPPASDPAEAALVARKADVEAVLEFVARAEATAVRLAEAERVSQSATAKAEEAARAVGDAQARLDATRVALVEAVKAWHLVLPPFLAEATPLEALVGTVDAIDAGGPTIRDEVTRAWEPVRDELTRQASAACARAKHLDEQIADRQAQIVRIEAEYDDQPPAAPHRPAPREGRAGAPLWRLVRFRDDLSEADHAGLEGALLGAGLLDAWLDPLDVPRPDGTEDAFLVVGPPAPGPSLAALLVPEAQDHVPVERVAAFLASFPLASAGLGVDSDGRFRLGPLVGAHRPEHARFVGATARAAYRVRRVRALRDEVAEFTRRRAVESAALDEVVARRRAVDEASGRLPSAKAVLDGRRALDTATGSRNTAEKHAVDARSVRDKIHRQHDEETRSARAEAARRGVPAERGPLSELGAQVAHTREGLAGWREALAAHSEAAGAFEQASGELADRERDEASARREQGGADTTATERERAYETLRATAGEDARVVVERLDAVLVQRDELRKALDETRIGLADAERAQATFEGEAKTIRERLPDAREQLRVAEAALDVFAHPALMALLGVSEAAEPFPERHAVAVVGASTTDDWLRATETRLAGRLEGLDAELGAFRTHRRAEDEITLLEIEDDAGRHSLPTFAARLAERVETVGALLVQHERQLFEDQVLGNLCNQLRGRIEEAHRLVRAMDDAMRDRRLSSGQSVRIAWRVRSETEPARKEILELLRRDAIHLGPDTLDRIRRHFAEQVRSGRREKPDRSYLELLRGALDHRAWHEFELSLVEAGGEMQRLGRKRHAQLSGGEKSATLHLPLFAAAHAHFQAASRTAPRLVALDEAFAGIDDRGVPELLRLAADFDLDWLVTGYDLWITEPFLPAVMHYDLAHDTGSRVVSALPILWNGVETIEGDEALEAVR